MYDAVIIGAGISGSVSAKIIAQQGFKVLLLDSKVPPRDKVCSGVQLKYMEKLIGSKIPEDALCSNRLNRVRLTRPSGKTLEGSMSLLNYWRRDFDNWLNELAVKAGAETRWNVRITGLELLEDSVKIILENSIIETRYVIGADGLSPGSFTRNYLYPDNFSEKVTGASLNYYYRGTSDVSPDTLYLYYRKGLSDLMYSWLYYKDDLLVVGTSSSMDLNHYAEVFLETVKKDFNLIGEEVGRDGFSTHCKGGVHLGEGRVLLMGDAAGLLDLYRGVGMDTAALSGRICAGSVVSSLREGGDALEIYRERSSKLVKMIEGNIKRQEKRFASDQALEESFSVLSLVRGTLKIIWASLWNRLCEPEDMILLPP